MSAILFGSIGTLVETSEVQRAAFNAAFQQHHLDWNWSRDQYQKLLASSGGRHRIDAYASSVGQSVDAADVHRTKSLIFQRSLRDGALQTRDGVTEIIREAKRRGIQVAFVTTTSRENVDALLTSISKAVRPADFDLIVDVTQVESPKPSPSCYQFAVARLGEQVGRCVAIEDNPDGVAAAKAAGLPCVAFPVTNTSSHDYASADTKTHQLDFGLLEQHLNNQVPV